MAGSLGPLRHATDVRCISAPIRLPEVAANGSLLRDMAPSPNSNEARARAGPLPLKHAGGAAIGLKFPGDIGVCVTVNRIVALSFTRSKFMLLKIFRHCKHHRCTAQETAVSSFGKMKRRGISSRT